MLDMRVQTEQTIKKEFNAIGDSQLQDSHMLLDRVSDPNPFAQVTKSGVSDSHQWLRLFSSDDLERVLAEQAKDSKLKPRLLEMKKEGDVRVLGLVNDRILDSLVRLKTKFPNFNDVLDHYHKSLLLSTLVVPAVLFLPPILLLGPPGIGKTRFLRELAKVLEIDFFQVDMATTSAGWVLSGNSSSWSDGRPGFISSSIRQSKVGNPIILVDEIDKSSEGNYDPMGCLYSLLERQTAKEFVDECLTFPIDCSFVNWVASANDINGIPDPIRSRMRIFNVEMPTTEQMPAIAQSVYNDLLDENKWGERFYWKLSKKVLDELTVVSPRSLKSILVDAAAEVAVKRSPSKGKLCITVEDIEIESDTERRPMGFL
jgi:ATP-dependent Lon protease